MSPPPPHPIDTGMRRDAGNRRRWVESGVPRRRRLERHVLVVGTGWVPREYRRLTVVTRFCGPMDRLPILVSGKL